MDIANLQEPDKKSRDRADFFVCPICANVVRDPLECSGCQSVFCTRCIEPWREKNEHCPKKCKGNDSVEWREMHRMVKQDLLSLKFKCNNNQCSSVNTYEAALGHLETCNSLMQPCTQGCGLGILGSDMPFHVAKQCSMAGEICKNCEEMRFTNRKDEHDCIKTLKENLKKAREEIQQLKQGGYSQGVVHSQGDSCLKCITCNGPHGLSRHVGAVEEYNGNPKCDLCEQEDL